MMRRYAVALAFLLAPAAAVAGPLNDLTGPQDPSQFVQRENTLRREINANFVPTFPVNPVTVFGQLTLTPSGGTLTIAGATHGPSNSMLYGTAPFVTGVYTGFQPFGVFEHFIDSFAVDYSAVPTGQARGTRFLTNLGGANQFGGFINFDSTLVINQATGNTTNKFYEAGHSEIDVSINEGGVAGLAGSGSSFAHAFYARLLTGATFRSENSISEGDISNATGTNVLYSYGHKIILENSNQVAPSLEFSAFAIGAGGSAAQTLTCVLCVGTYSSPTSGLASTASIISYSRHAGVGSYPQATIAYGIDLFYFDTTSAAWRGPNGTSTIDDAGNITGAATVTGLKLASATHQGATAGGTMTFGGDAATYNEVQIVPGTTGNPVAIKAIGVDADQTLRMLGHGVSGVDLGTDTNGIGVRASADASSVNFWDMHGAAAGAGGGGAGLVYMGGIGADTVVYSQTRCKGTACVIDLNPDAGTGGGRLRVKQGGGVQVGTPTGADKGSGSLNIAGTIWSNGTQGIASCTIVTAAATITITNGIVTGFTGC